MAENVKVKVGDKVRSLVAQMDVEEGKEYVVQIVGINGTVHILDDVGDPWYLYRNEYELVTAPEFKVGDRVRVVDIGLMDNTRVSVGDTAVVRCIGPHTIEVEFCNAQGSFNQFARRISFEPFRIEAGKYYKTRDGRKVGPLTCNWYGVFSATGYPYMWYETGFSYLDKKEQPTDLISEWVDEAPAPEKPRYSVNAAAQVDVQREEYGTPFVVKNGVLSLTAATLPSDTAERKFPVGSRVVRANGHNPHIAGTVTGHISPDYNTVSWDNGLGDSAMWQDYELRLVAPTTSDNTPAIVALIEDGQPKPSERPHVHPDRVSAEREAKRLAGKHPGKQFGVYEFVSSVKEHKHEWQRLAADGQRFNAIRALIRVTGMSMKSAKDAVDHFLAA